ncbi:phosphopentomutase [Chakrabartyella piscis]|uniref:phosphopentomutase n=1 Tax=Chakrabartyella piscis TaxID=2918914 RepID=UPI002958BAC4|nr:phosphopentomutase [Chakrabartyella piscis]
MKRTIIIVLDSVGIGELPDAADFGDVGSNTLVNIKKNYPSMSLPNMCALGLGNITGEEVHTLGKVEEPKGVYCKLAETSIGKDTTTGHWEIAGIITEKPFPTYTETGFPKEVMDEFEALIGTKTLGNCAASGTAIIEQLGDEHVKTGYPIVYTSADSVFQIAAHEEVISVEQLYDMCEKARKMLCGEHAVARVIARPFVGDSGAYTRTKNRKDFSLEPTGVTMLDLAKEKGLNVTAIGKIEDIFEHRGITRADHTTNNADGIEKTIFYTKEEFEGILFTNLVDTDMMYGHRNDVEGYAKALEYFDGKLPEIMAAMHDEDILIVTADHGCDPTTASTDHSREYVPMLVVGKHVKQGVDLGVRKSFADIGQTVSEYLDLGANFKGESFLKDILK